MALFRSTCASPLFEQVISRGILALKSITFSLETEIQFSVSVPVLSKTMTEILPDTLILDTLVQLIWLSFSFFSENITPTLIATGSSGGTENDNASRTEYIISFTPKYSINFGSTIQIKIKLIIANIKIYIFSS